MTKKRWSAGMALAGLTMLAPVSGQAHPHIFVDTGIEVIFDATGAVEALRIRWTYDDLYSLSIIGERGLDPDWDGKLTPEEETALAGFDMNWIEGFEGDTYALLADQPLVLGPPIEPTAGFDGGRITSTHLRKLAVPVRVADVPLIVQVYDPGFYTAYTIAHDAVLTGREDCAAQAYEPDIDAADEILLAALAEYAPDQDAEMDFPAVGKNYAEEVRVTCAAP